MKLVKYSLLYILCITGVREVDMGGDEEGADRGGSKLGQRGAQWQEEWRGLCRDLHQEAQGQHQVERREVC